MNLGTHFLWGGILSFLSILPFSFSSIFPQGRQGCSNHWRATVLYPMIGDSWRHVFLAPMGAIPMHIFFFVVQNASKICLPLLSSWLFQGSHSHHASLTFTGIVFCSGEDSPPPALTVGLDYSSFLMFFSPPWNEHWIQARLKWILWRVKIRTKKIGPPIFSGRNIGKAWVQGSTAKSNL